MNIIKSIISAAAVVMMLVSGQSAYGQELFIDIGDKLTEDIGISGGYESLFGSTKGMLTNFRSSSLMSSFGMSLVGAR